MSIRIIDSLHEVAASEWNALELNGNPFLRHEFLLALEAHHCADARTGWQAQHLLLHDDGTRELIGAIPLYLKRHSWGEFVFDWSWASAFSQHGLEYYPKLTCAIPFTPATGPRLLARSDATRATLADELKGFAEELNVSSTHVLFATEADVAALETLHFLRRCDCQFHWRNRDYASFDDFIATFRADKRKKALRERRRVAEAGIRFEWRSGNEMNDDLWNRVFALSAATFARHGHEHYLNAA
ncbi:MAG TPA: peptidogalycan biosysnthesis protein, partial [Steroidobacteraceae bacterium]|nr:peptidogalycan biosysnthesis protein [Steroidobacteraceae bacterium]